MRKTLLRSFRKTVNASVDNVAKVLSFRDWTVPFEWLLDRDASAFDANNQRTLIISPDLVEDLMIEKVEVEELPANGGHTMNIEWQSSKSHEALDAIPFCGKPKVSPRSTVVVHSDEEESTMCTERCMRGSSRTHSASLDKGVTPAVRGLRGRTQQLWTSSSLVCSEDKAPASTVTLSDRAGSGGKLSHSVKRSIVESIEKFGFALIQDPSLSQDGENATQMVQRRYESAEGIITDLFSFLRNSHYGAMSTWSDSTSWKDLGKEAASPASVAAEANQEFIGSESHLDGAYQSTLLDLHTDCTYFVDCPKLQAFGCILTSPSTFGGQTTMSDGAAAAMRLRELHPHYFDILTSIPVGGRYHKEGRWYESFRPVITLTPCGSYIERIAFNNSDRIPMGLSLKCDELRNFYKAYFAFHELAHRHAIRFLLKPGQLLFFDNHRALHGRLQFKGPRVMCGAYIGTDEYLSAYRTLLKR